MTTPAAHPQRAWVFRLPVVLNVAGPRHLTPRRVGQTIGGGRRG